MFKVINETINNSPDNKIRDINIKEMMRANRLRRHVIILIDDDIKAKKKRKQKNPTKGTPRWVVGAASKRRATENSPEQMWRKT